jgi:DNA processing protein
VTTGPPVRRLRRGDDGWPAGFDHLELPPSALWMRGPGRLDVPAVAIVGARDATLDGLNVARRLAADLATAGITVISGMALGIDGAAHRGALDVEGPTVAVLGCGIDVDYPIRHRDLRERIARSGALLTEEPPGTMPAPWRFPRRNRLIAALALAVVVVEAGHRSGALSTARHAADLGREVFAVPGSVLSDRSSGANALLRDGATPLTETADLAAVAALAPAIDAARARFRLTADRPNRTTTTTARTATTTPQQIHPDLAPVLRLLGPRPLHPDQLAASLRLPPAALAARLAELELAGLASTIASGLVVRNPGD